MIISESVLIVMACGRKSKVEKLLIRSRIILKQKVARRSAYAERLQRRLLRPGRVAAAPRDVIPNRDGEVAYSEGNLRVDRRDLWYTRLLYYYKKWSLVLDDFCVVDGKLYRIWFRKDRLGKPPQP